MRYSRFGVVLIPVLVTIGMAAFAVLMSIYFGMAFSSKARADHFNPVLQGPEKVCAGGPKYQIFPVEVTHGEWNLDKDSPIEHKPEVLIPAWMFNGSLPGEVYEACEGDTVDYDFHNNGPAPHGFDPHALNIGAEAFEPVKSGGSRHIVGVADIPGIFMHHCAAGKEFTDRHIVMGMGSATIVYPRKRMPKALDFAVVIGATTDGRYFFNGSFANKPLRVKVGQRVRFWIQSVAHGHNTIHIIGENDTTFYSGWNTRTGRFVSSGASQGYTLTNGGGMIVEFTAKKPGRRILVDHDKLDQLNTGFALPIIVE